jgi:hypothetical protein
MSSWVPYNEGITIGTKGLQGDVILMDEAYPGGARVTLKRGAKYVSVSCSINNWINHTRFFKSAREAKRELGAMKDSLVEVINLLTVENADQIKIWEAISNFVRRFP